MVEYGNPESILIEVLSSRPLTTNDILGHTPIGDFEHFCSVTGCPKDKAWAKLAFVWKATAQSDGYALLSDCD